MAAASPARVHGALLLTQFCWGSAAVVNKAGLSGVGVLPVLYALVREATAAPMLFGLLWLERRSRGPGGVEEGCSTPEQQRPRPRAPALLLRLAPGLFIFVDQLCSLVGVSLADGFTGAAWQPTQVVFTVVISGLLGTESLARKQLLGVALTVCGALCMVFLGGGAGRQAGPHRELGHLLFLSSSLASSLEIIVWRKMLKHASAPLAHFQVMAESYLVASCLMATACVITSVSPAATDFLCPGCGGNPWHFPTEALWAVAYSVIFQTIVGYLAQAWALCHAEATLASMYIMLQPVMAALVTSAFLILRFNPGGSLTWPAGREMLGAVLIIAGLFVTQQGPSLVRPRDAATSPAAAAPGEDQQLAGPPPCGAQARPRPPAHSSLLLEDPVPDGGPQQLGAPLGQD